MKLKNQSKIICVFFKHVKVFQPFGPLKVWYFDVYITTHIIHTKFRDIWEVMDYMEMTNIFSYKKFSRLSFQSYRFQ